MSSEQNLPRQFPAEEQDAVCTPPPAATKCWPWICSGTGAANANVYCAPSYRHADRPVLSSQGASSCSLNSEHQAKTLDPRAWVKPRCRRQRWTAEERLRILAEAAGRRACVADIARAFAASARRNPGTMRKPSVRRRPTVEAVQGHDRNAGGDPACMEGHPDGPGEILWPCLQDHHATAGADPCRAA